MSAPDILITEAMVQAALARHIGRATGVTIVQLTREITGGTTDASLQRRVRQLVMELRDKGEHICATPESGYFMAENDEELNETRQLLFDRAMSGLSQAAAMKRVSLPDLAGQLHLKPWKRGQDDE